MASEDLKSDIETLSPPPSSRIALWIGGSALLGSVALVLWNRRLLRALREAAENPALVTRSHDEDGIY